MHDERAVSHGEILLIEDDPAVLRLLQAVMQYGGFTSGYALSTADALQALSSKSYASVLLDHLTETKDRRKFIEDIRRLTDVPIIVVSGHDDERTRIEALDAGADDFVPKPFLPGELLARVRAAIRRRPGKAEAVELTGTHPAPVGFGGVRWTKTEEKLLTLLRVHEGELVTTEDIIKHVWTPKQNRSERNVRVLIASLRRNLKVHRLPFEILNQHGLGYRLRRVEAHATRSASLQ